MRLAPAVMAALILFYGWSCHYHDDDDYHHHGLEVDDVFVEITGDSGAEFEAFFEDDRGRVGSASGAVPFDADFVEMVGFFSAVVDKTESNDGTVCVEVTTHADSERSCTSIPFGRASVLVLF